MNRALGFCEITSKGLTFVPLEFQKEMRECGAGRHTWRKID